MFFWFEEHFYHNSIKSNYFRHLHILFLQKYEEILNNVQELLKICKI